MPDTLERLIGETLVFGIPGPRPTQEDLRLFRDTHAAGLILYRINFRSPSQIKHLIREMEESLGRRLLVTVDHEGGRVIMFQSGVTIFPDNLAFGAAGGTTHSRTQGAIEGRELRRLGINVAFSPTVDVLTDAFSPNIGIRSYGKDPRIVARMATARLQALQQEGVSACAKHFPGLGPAILDPHLDLPRIPVTWRELRHTHLVPFRAAIKAGVDMIMSSHPLYPNVDPTPKTPATFSHRLITDLLRNEMKFPGVVASDDLEMGALRSLSGVGRAAVLAARAGHDLLLCCHKNHLQRTVFNSLRNAYRSGDLSVSNLEKTVERIRSLRGAKQPRFSFGPPVAEPWGNSLARTVARKAVHVTPGHVPLPLKQKRKTLILFPRLSELSQNIMIEPNLCRERFFLQTHVPPRPRPQIGIIPIDPRPVDIAHALRSSAGGAVTVFFCFDAHLQTGNRKLLDAFQKSKLPLVVVLMRDPYDRVFVKSSTTVVCAYGYRQVQIEACLEKIFQ